jgi:hypothetical protein
MAGGGFNFPGSALDGKPCKLMPVYDTPMHFEKADDFSLNFSWVNTSVVKKHKYHQHRHVKRAGHSDHKL